MILLSDEYVLDSGKNVFLETKSASPQPDGCRFVAELDQLRRAGRARPSNARLPRLRPSGEVLPFAKKCLILAEIFANLRLLIFAKYA